MWTVRDGHGGDAEDVSALLAEEQLWDPGAGDAARVCAGCCRVL